MEWNIDSVRNFVCSKFILEWKQSLLQNDKQKFIHYVMRTLYPDLASLNLDLGFCL